uniref:Uncharacterized protein n=1 Tax=Lepeophtheirus salmonis TaxID=72036 RepID=A0A0K2TMQ2_LEPSM
MELELMLTQFQKSFTIYTTCAVSLKFINF